MATDADDRQRMRDDLRELAKTAKKEAATPPPPPVHALESADSSGYVDLSAFSASDPDWVTRELERASARAPAMAPQPTRGPESMAPLSMEALGSSREEEAALAARRRRRFFAVGAVIAGAGAALAVLGVVRHASLPGQASTQPVGAAAAMATTAAPEPSTPPQATAPDPQAAGVTRSIPAVGGDHAEGLEPAARTGHAARKAHGAQAAPAGRSVERTLAADPSPETLSHTASVPPSPVVPASAPARGEDDSALGSSPSAGATASSSPAGTAASASHSGPPHAGPAAPAASAGPGGDSLIDLIKASVKDSKH